MFPPDFCLLKSDKNQEERNLLASWDGPGKRQWRSEIYVVEEPDGKGNAQGDQRAAELGSSHRVQRRTESRATLVRQEHELQRLRRKAVANRV